MSESDDNIEVPFDLFWNRRYKNVELEARVHTRIDALLVKYDCFTKDDLFYPPPVASGVKSYKGARNFNKGVRYTHHVHPSENPILKKPRTPLKEIQGLLNKITKASFVDFVQKMIRCCAYRECAKDVINEIIKKCFIHGSYSELYHGLLREMYERYREDTTLAIEKFVNDFLNTLSTDLASLEFLPNPNHDYEGYCLYVKSKAMIRNKLMNILVLLRGYSEVLDASSIKEQLFRTFSDKLETVIRFNEKTHYDFIDMLSQLIVVMDKEKAITAKNGEDLIFIYNDLKSAFPGLPIKIHFCWEEILRSK